MLKGVTFIKHKMMLSNHKLAVTHVHTNHIEEAPNKQYLSGLIDGEASFIAYPYERHGKWYLAHYTEMTLLATREWTNTADYLQSVYGGHTRVVEKYYYRWTLWRHEDLLKFLNDFIPTLRIKRQDAERLRASLIAYFEITDRGQPTEEFWRKWIVRFRLRELKPLTV